MRHKLKKYEALVDRRFSEGKEEFKIIKIDTKSRSFWGPKFFCHNEDRGWTFIMGCSLVLKRIKEGNWKEIN